MLGWNKGTHGDIGIVRFEEFLQLFLDFLERVFCVFVTHILGNFQGNFWFAIDVWKNGFFSKFRIVVTNGAKDLMAGNLTKRDIVLDIYQKTNYPQKE
ncbi:MAG: hypothetical protein KDD43_17030, partial [Bdellovibrionales bacterium]|nr:hypothetical protein [Bdellovibrionales bacterium]